MGSGLIYAALVVMWAAYFIPRWLRRHEELSEARSVERFDRAMRILSRKEPTPDRRYVVMPPRPEPSDAAPRRRGRSLMSRSRRSVGFGASGRSGRSGRRPVSVAVRRRRVLAGLLLTTLVASLLTPLAAVDWWAPLAALAVTVGYLVHCRLQVRTRHQVDRTREAVRKRYRSRFLRFESLERLLAVRRELAEQRAADDARWQEAEEALRREEEAEEERRLRAEAEWSPVPVPLPTYVTKPPAPRPAPPIDLTNPGAWTEAQTQPVPEQKSQGPHDAPHSQGMAALLDQADEADEELDAIITRRAVND